jgi:multidrug resistance efflux pump
MPIAHCKQASLGSGENLRYRESTPKAGGKKSTWILGGLFVLGAVPVHMSVLAPGELVAAQPVVLRAPLDGVIDQIHVQPNQMVRKGERLFGLDEAQISSRLAVARQALLTAEAEYRQSAQLAGRRSLQGATAAFVGRIGEKRAEVQYLSDQRDRSRVLAPEDGMVLFDSPTEWLGKPVQTGERVMRIARPDEVEIEAWVPIGDAIPLAQGSTVKLYLAANPMAGLEGKLRYMAYDANARPDGSYAYRVRASMSLARRRLVSASKVPPSCKAIGCLWPTGFCASPGPSCASLLPGKST